MPSGITFRRHFGKYPLVLLSPEGTFEQNGSHWKLHIKATYYMATLYNNCFHVVFRQSAPIELV